tara:strand:- start:20946 stop:22190 length:1245 start_codon:yes stop_codon:yes gene_type:complete
MLVHKRDGSIEEFDRMKAAIAVEKAMGDTSLGVRKEAALEAAHLAHSKLMWNAPTEVAVDEVHEAVEEALMRIGECDVARSYIQYRERHKPDIFRKRENYLPREYPELHRYTDAIRQSYWVHTSYPYAGDVQDFRANMTERDKSAILRAMLGISQVEVKVKDFWTKIGDIFQKPEIQEVGVTFGESEARHANAYAHLIEILQLQDEFSKVLEVPAIRDRVRYISKAMAGAKTDSRKEYVETILLFSLFIENVSLFSQFLIISAFNKETAMLKGISNAVEATSLEENIHFMFGAELINVIRKENPGMFDTAMEERVQELVQEAYEAERNIVRWIFEQGEFDYLTVKEVEEYIKLRFNTGLVQCGFEEAFELDESLLERTKWFDLQINAGIHTDFFAKHPVGYSKFKQEFSGDSLF